MERLFSVRWFFMVGVMTIVYTLSRWVHRKRAPRHFQRQAPSDRNPRRLLACAFSILSAQAAVALAISLISGSFSSELWGFFIGMGLATVIGELAVSQRVGRE
jgi:hypothetical protein